ncbi:MAG: cytochrome D1 domain-containing protein [Campylobacterota bacterium]|nr:cytochrome D1 domain-containing protein [Campylobacterota bacterium]
MKLNKLVLSTVAAATLMATGAAAFDADAVFEKDCQGCHGPAHQGGVGSDLRPDVLRNKNDQELASVILNGKAGTAMVPFKKGESIGHEFSQTDADAMVKYLKNFTGKQPMVLTLANLKAKWVKINDRMKLFKQFPKSNEVDKVTDICFVTERDASKVTFLDGTKGTKLSTHPAGFAVHVTVTNKRMPRYAYSISRDGLLTMFDLMSDGQQKIAEVRVGTSSRGLAVSPDGKYVMAGNYEPGGAMLFDAMTLEPLKVYPTSSVINNEGNIESSRVASIADTPYGPYFAFALKDAGHVYIVDYSKPGFPVVGDIPNIGNILHDAFLNEGKEIGRYYMIASQGSDVVGIVDFKTKTLAAKVYTGTGSKPHPGQGSSWYNEQYGQLHATVNMNVGQVTVWDNNWDVVRHIPVAGGGLFVGTSEHTPYIWADNVLGGSANWNTVHLIDKQHLEVGRIITVGKDKGTLTKSDGTIIESWDVPHSDLVPRILHAEPANHGNWTMISEWNTGRIGIYEAKTGKFVKYITGLTTPTFTYSIEHRQTIPGA